MSFQNKVDKFGIADGTTILINSVAENATIQEVTAMGEDGSIIANETFGENASPACTYTLKSSLRTNPKNIVLGGVTTVDDKHYVLTSVEVGTTAGGMPTISAKGERVPNATADCTYTINGGLDIEAKAHAQNILSSFTLSGTGNHLTDCNAAFECSFQVATKDGERLAWDVTEGKILITGSIVQAGNVEPTITPAEGWTVNSILTKTNPDSNYPTWSFGLVKYLAKD